MWKSCLRGGWLARFNRRTYFSIGRFFKELILSDQLQRSEIAASKILAFSATRRGLGYQVDQLIQLEDHVISVHDLLADKQCAPQREQVRRTGELIYRFHEAGFLHGDLNLMNIMVNEKSETPAHALLVDLDPGGIPPGTDRMGNLARLARSYSKVVTRGGCPLSSGDRFRFLYHATGGDRNQLREALIRCNSILPETERVR